MSASRTERLMNLLIMLLVQRHYLAKERIRELLYPDQGTEAFERMFERDKEALRALGVPIEVGALDAYFDDEVGYRISPAEFALPEIELDAEEASVIGLATRVWGHQRLAHATSEAVRKLRAAGIQTDLAALDIAQPQLGADEPGFDVVWDAVVERREIEFDYRRSAAGSAARRRLQPWGITRYAGRWYVVGHDLDRGERRVFRLSRVQGEVLAVGEPGAFEVPADVDLASVARALVPPRDGEPAVILARTDRALPLRRRATRVETGVPGPDARTGWDRVHLPGTGSLADDVLALGDHVVVEAPASLREEVRARLVAAVGARAGGAP
ncbi:helix-turn-helix transcriptional regulator [Nocardioides sp.]|uniref:helix-turn-helix transcriptional regulator n=1 Tax=Nocardioides sp. TaxID=35761 RepID=UPI003513054A